MLRLFETHYIRDYSLLEGLWDFTVPDKDKPIIMSEFGGAALYGHRDPARRKWSEERQADIVDSCLELYMNSPETAGGFIWHLADCRVTDEGGWFFSRARCHNNKGIFDEYRRPKLAAEVVKKHFKK